MGNQIYSIGGENVSYWGDKIDSIGNRSVSYSGSQISSIEKDTELSNTIRSKTYYNEAIAPITSYSTSKDSSSYDPPANLIDGIIKLIKSI